MLTIINGTIMKKYIYKLSLLSFLLCILTGCEKDEVMFYDSQNNSIRFPISDLSSYEPYGYDMATKQFRSSWTFADNPDIEYTIYDLPVMLIGNPTDNDRKISFEISDESYAPEGSYEILEAKIPAGEVKGHIRFKLYNVKELAEKTYFLLIKLGTSNELQVGPDQYLTANFLWNNSIPAFTNSYFTRTYNMLIKSSLGFTSTSTANYSSRALKTIVSALNWNDWDDYSVHGANYNSSTTYSSYKYLPRYTVIYLDNSYKSYAYMLSLYIAQYNQEHPDEPLIHDAGGLKGQRIEARSY